MYDAFTTGALYISLIGLLLLGIIVIACMLFCGIKLALVAVKVALKGIVRRMKRKTQSVAHCPCHQNTECCPGPRCEGCEYEKGGFNNYDCEQEAK